MATRRRLLAWAALALACPALAVAQTDGCRGALDALNRVKESITPRLTSADPAGRQTLVTMQSTLENGTRVCQSYPELWFYRMVVSQRLGQQKDVDYARLRVGSFDPGFDPFSPPPAAPVQVAQNSPTAVAPLPGVASSSVRRKWALVVGIDKFEDERVPSLHYAVKDSRDFGRYLTDPKGGRFAPSHVFLLSDKEATLKGIREGLGKLRQRAKPDDLIVIYFSTHGSPRQRDPNGVSYIIAEDTDLENSATLYASSLQMIDLVQTANRELKARHVVLILDTCYSGGALANPNTAAGADAAGDFSAAFNNLGLGYGRAVLTASQADEQSWESDKLGDGGNGYFTHYLLAALKESKQQETLEQVFGQVRSRVSASVKAQLQQDQNPSFKFSDQARDIVLTAPELEQD